MITRKFVDALISKGYQVKPGGMWMQFGSKPKAGQTLIISKPNGGSHEYKCSAQEAQDILKAASK